MGMSSGRQLSREQLGVCREHCFTQQRFALQAEHPMWDCVQLNLPSALHLEAADLGCQRSPVLS